MLDYYKYFLKNGHPEFDERTKDEWTMGDRKDKNLSDILKNEFEITNNHDDFVTIADMNKFKIKNKECFSTISAKRFNELVFDTFKIPQSRKGKNNITGWVALKQKIDIYEI